ncbi:hypothetical protein Vch1786_I0679 [Vibrio cholerae O1 str. 2010EL-1786]|uniref:Uncharacterized protein n=2 Tax=Vibrio cholerae TaxID=666 RepID=Q9KST1_VIBCH|nr:hypothetical protein VC_1175 [Vibrio cholerae O1 biovar El Tor str. N16961]ACP05447.1 conserved hypothetical protein [Vibrio cholerae M66-2]ACP09302.1 conserved hypothetical protein [Vibrio cholerae O395]ACQ61328.1 hypothetical protein VCD_003168 [Vibrio cholerae MJ-1236]AET26287.1 hypothetical protein Vch1786_I0679 [Vibrio cholerae O1 str. 2010EL-1786]EEO09908.1 hypothetical protein VCC_002243 [Vibrio cholerae RC9]EEO16005.1 hypothetical protein VCE_002506 [Vibrio cholerae B33]EEO22371.1
MSGLFIGFFHLSLLFRYFLNAVISAQSNHG